MSLQVEHLNQSLPPVTNRWRDVFCIIENVYTDLDLANAVSQGIFTNAGKTIEIGTETDWRSTKLPQDEEWKIEWYKFYFGLDLAHAFATTGDEVYRSTWKRLVQSWIAQMHVGCDSSDVAARRILNWIYAWNSFTRASAVSRGELHFENQLVASLGSHVRHLRQHLTAERNHRTLELYALFIAALALPELDEHDLLGFAMTELHRNLLRDVRPDGVHREQSTHYHMTALRSFLGARENARRFGYEFPTEYDKRLQKACEFLMHVQRPDGLIPALSDADTGRYSDLLELAADIFDRSDFLYVATNGARGERPAETCVSFPDGGYFIQRSGWRGANENYLVFDCGPLGDGGHGHYDALNIEVAANGRPLIVDPGRFTYDDSPERRLFKGTAAHNTVCVDDLDQTPFHRGKPKGPVAQARLIERVTTPDFDMLCGEVRSPAYDTVHTRRIFFVRGKYWVVVDSLRGSSPHKFELRFHLGARINADQVTRIRTDWGVGVRTPELELLFGSDVRLRIEMGWVSKSYGVKEAAPVVSVVSEGKANVDFYTLIVPQQVTLAPDSNLPQRDQLLDEAAMARHFAARECRLLRTKYRPGVSLRTLYEVSDGQKTFRVAARAYPNGTSFWNFPADKKIRNLSLLENIPEELSNINGRRWTRSRIVAHAPEKSVTAQCLAEDDAVLAYAKIYAGDEGETIFNIYNYLNQKPRALSYSIDHHLLLLEPVAGTPLNTVAVTEREEAFRLLGIALKKLHRITPPDFLSRHRESTPESLLRTAETIGAARPDVSDRAQQLAEALIAAHQTNNSKVLLHGDPHPKNVLLSGQQLSLLDLDQAALGSPMLDVASVIAGIQYDCCIGSISKNQLRTLTEAFLDGYGPVDDSLRWHVAAALFEERALRTITRVRRDGLRKLPELLDLVLFVPFGGK
ncbi:MAG TPA: heparinase II/III family protein [Pyrinomonadaceae bacterium]|nr:heparinase II/III family protein [Pyrinomonadaceae bacterium]